MHLRKSWLLVSVLAALAVQASTIYKWTDADGVVHYSDQAVPGAEKVVTSSINRSNSPGSGATAGRAAPGAGSGSGAGKPAPATYHVAITSPAAEQTFFAADVASVQLDIQPPLKPTDAIVWKLNGRLLDQPATAVAFSLQGLERGTYNLTATIVDQSGEAENTQSVTFYFRQPSALAPLHR